MTVCYACNASACHSHGNANTQIVRITIVNLVDTYMSADIVYTRHSKKTATMTFSPDISSHANMHLLVYNT